MYENKLFLPDLNPALPLMLTSAAATPVQNEQNALSGTMNEKLVILKLVRNSDSEFHALSLNGEIKALAQFFEKLSLL